MRDRFLRHCVIPALPGLLLLSSASGQVSVFPYAENFDSSSSAALPAGWGSSRNRGTGGDDFAVSQSAPRSAPNCVAASNATIAQTLTSPVLNFTGVVPETVTWFMRRSSTFTSPIIVEFSTDDGGTWQIIPGDTLLPDGSVSYVESVRGLPVSIAGMRCVRIRWRTLPSTTGSTGTLRFDDVSVTVHGASDIALLRLSFSPPLPHAGDPVAVTGVVKNVGLKIMAGFSLGLYRSAGDTVHPVPGELIALTAPSPALEPGDSAVITLSGVSLTGGVNRLIGVLHDTSDTNPSDNSLSLEIDIVSPAGAVVINEILFAPFAGEGEYVELLNNSAGTLNITGWRLTAGSGISANPRTLLLPDIPAPLAPGQCIVAAEDSGIFHFFPSLTDVDARRVIVPRVWETRLNNAGEDIVLRDRAGSVIDSVFYLPSWHNPAVIDRTGRSLERILGSGNSNDPGNWSTCTLTEGGTPARANSVALRGGSTAGGISASPNPFSPDADGFEDATVIRYRIPRGVWSVTVRIFDARGRVVRTLATCAPSTGEGECIWDGRDQEKAIARMGIYVVYIEATDESRLTSFAAKGVVVLAHRLY